MFVTANCVSVFLFEYNSLQSFWDSSKLTKVKTAWNNSAFRWFLSPLFAKYVPSFGEVTKELLPRNATLKGIIKCRKLGRFFSDLVNAKKMSYFSNGR